MLWAVPLRGRLIVVCMSMLDLRLGWHQHQHACISLELKANVTAVKLLQCTAPSFVHKHSPGREACVMRRQEFENLAQVKEVALMHSEGILAGKMKHGPLALVDECMPVIVIVTRDSMYAKMHAVIQQLRARGARVVLLCNFHDPNIEALASPDCQLIQIKSTTFFHVYLVFACGYSCGTKLSVYPFKPSKAM